jgi:hypothetical protein
MFTLKCPGCTALLKIPIAAAGQTGTCPTCGVDLQIPALEKPRAPSPKKIIRRGSSPGIAPGGKASVAPVKRSLPGPSPRTPQKPKKRKIAGLLASLFVFALLGGALLWRFLPRQPGTPAAATSAGPIDFIRAVSAPVLARAADASAAPPRASSWDVSAPARVSAYQFGGSGKEEIRDMAVRGDGRLVVTGTLSSRDGIPAAAGKKFDLIDSQGGALFGFVAEFSPDGQTLNWFSTFGGDLFQPNRIALGPDGSIALGGGALTRLAAASKREFKGRTAAVVKVAADGSRVEWVGEGGPNSAGVTGIAVDAKGRVVFTAGTLGKGNAAYILRKEANGADSTFSSRGNRDWCIDFDVRSGEFLNEGQVGAFYQKGRDGAGFDYDGSAGKWGPVRFNLSGIRQGGRVLVLPDGDIVAAGTLQYDFREGSNKWFPAFDLIVARFAEDGRLKWSTNLYQPGDSVHTPDQKDKDLLYNPVNGDLYVLAIQHGSNVYRFKGQLGGDTGNLMLGWVGQVDANTGSLKNGWYWQNSRNTGYDSNGIPISPPYPKLAGNRPDRLGVDGQGRIYMSGNAGPLAFTTPTAWKNWPADQAGGGNASLTILSPNLDRILYATMIRGDTGNASAANTLAVTEKGIWVGGDNGTPNFSSGPQPAWSNPRTGGERDAALSHFRFE